MARYLRSIDLIKPTMIPGPSVNVLTTITHRGLTGHELTLQDDNSVVVSHPRVTKTCVFPASSIVKYEWDDQPKTAAEPKIKAL
jgi:hypothetical protein